MPTFARRVHLGPALAHDDRARGDRFAAVGLDAEALGLRIAAVTGTAACFCVPFSIASPCWRPQLRLSEVSADDTVDLELGEGLPMALMPAGNSSAGAS